MEVNTNLLLFLASVVFISLSGVMMPGPVFAVTIAKGHKNKNAGVFIAFGHGIIELPLMLIIYLGFAQFFTSDTFKLAVGSVGGVMLILMGVQMFRTRKSMATEGRDLPYNSLTAGIITSGANPYFFLWWATIGATLILTASGFGLFGFLLFVAVHWLCDFFWYLFVSVATFKSKHLWSRKIHEIVFGMCSAILVVFGLWFIGSAF
ncbi:MAG: LysE family transporter [Deltaproteobacteria bacterium]|nr:MAG: LysE family transporter [Deltaproteobacteria bacterium]